MRKKGGYNRINRLKYYRNVINIVNAHYREGYTTYSGIFRTFVKPFYPMSYGTFMKIINMPSVEKQLREEMENINKTPPAEDENPDQLNLFD